MHTHDLKQITEETAPQLTARFGIGFGCAAAGQSELDWPAARFSGSDRKAEARSTVHQVTVPPPRSAQVHGSCSYGGPSP